VREFYGSLQMNAVGKLMNHATIVGIYVSDRATVMPQPVEFAEVTKLGLVGDRYHQQKGTFSNSNPNESGRALTLIESEALKKYAVKYGVDLSPAEARRNLVTQGVPLNDLVGQEFYIGEVRVKGIRLCHPCQHLQHLTQKSVLEGLEQCGGLRADILNEGVIRVGDEVHFF
jgi:MOSC domain-containing protein YiiM